MQRATKASGSGSSSSSSSAFDGDEVSVAMGAGAWPTPPAAPISFTGDCNRIWRRHWWRIAFVLMSIVFLWALLATSRIQRCNKMLVATEDQVQQLQRLASVLEHKVQYMRQHYGITRVARDAGSSANSTSISNKDLDVALEDLFGDTTAINFIEPLGPKPAVTQTQSAVGGTPTNTNANTINNINQRPATNAARSPIPPVQPVNVQQRDTAATLQAEFSAAEASRTKAMHQLEQQLKTITMSCAQTKASLERENEELTARLAIQLNAKLRDEHACTPVLSKQTNKAPTTRVLNRDGLVTASTTTLSAPKRKPPADAPCLPRTPSLETFGYIDDSRSYVLVLGSGGAIGQSLVRLLEWHGYNVLQIKSRYHWDLRNEDSLSIFNKVKIAFAWLLAGDTQNLSKLSTFTEQYTRSLHENQIQLNNGAILSHTIPWLHGRRIPVVITHHINTINSPIAVHDSRLEQVERWSLEPDAQIKVVRLWNAIGRDHPSKMSPITAAMWSCLHTQQADLTISRSADEALWFTSAEDAAVQLVELYERWDYISDKLIDIAASTPVTETSMQVARIFSQLSSTCQLHIVNDQSPVQPDVSSTSRVSKSKILSATHPGDGGALFLGLERPSSRSFDTILARVFNHYQDRVHTQRPACKPYVSVIFAARSDDYGQGFIGRAQNFIDSFAFESHKYGLCAEIVIADWESQVPGQLYERIVWPSTLLGGGRVITVPEGTAVASQVLSPERLERYLPSAELRDRVLEFGELPMYEYLAKNVGARRARAPWLLICNPDSVISSEIVEFISRQQLEPTHFYRAYRVAGRELKPRSVPPSEILAEVASTLPVFVGGTTFLTDTSQAYIHESGDFLLVSREDFEAVGGCPEAPFNTHLDSMTMLKLASLRRGVFQSILAYPIYHQPHVATAGSRPAPSLDTIMQWGREMMCYGPESFIDSDWGLASTTLAEQQFLPDEQQQR